MTAAEDPFGPPSSARASGHGHQVEGWREVGGTACMANFDRSREREWSRAAAFSIPGFDDDPVALRESERLDFVDVITGSRSAYDSRSAA